MANSKEHSDQITDNWNAITSDVEMRYIVDLLIQKRVISPTDWDDMKKTHPLTKDQMQAFLTFLQKQPKSSFKKFIEALKESENYNHIVEILQHPVSRHQTSMQVNTQDQNLFNPTNFRLLWDEFHSSKRENDRRLEAMNSEIYNLKTLLATSENEIEELKEKNLKKEAKIAEISKDFTAEKQHRKEAESKLKNAEEDLERVRRENTELINLSRTTMETERLLREETEFKLRRSEGELARVDRENTDLSSSNFQNTRSGSETRLRKDAKSNQQMTRNRPRSVLTDSVESLRFNPQREQNMDLMQPEVEISSNETVLERQLAQLNRQLQKRTLERDELERSLKKSSICSIL